jgi:hypothetical protein
VNEQQRREFLLLVQAARLLIEIDGKFLHGVPDCIDNDGQRYQSEHACKLIQQIKVAVKRTEQKANQRLTQQPYEDEIHQDLIVEYELEKYPATSGQKP